MNSIKKYDADIVDQDSGIMTNSTIQVCFSKCAEIFYFHKQIIILLLSYLTKLYSLLEKLFFSRLIMLKIFSDLMMLSFPEMKMRRAASNFRATSVRLRHKRRSTRSKQPTPDTKFLPGFEPCTIWSFNTLRREGKYKSWFLSTWLKTNLFFRMLALTWKNKWGTTIIKFNFLKTFCKQYSAF